MKREILFRGKRADNGEWIYGYLIGNNVIVGEVVDFDDDYFNTQFWYKVDPETVGQFTGLTDKNGTKVFEGGIIKAPSGRLYVVIWSTWIHDEKRNKYLNMKNYDYQKGLEFYKKLEIFKQIKYKGEKMYVIDDIKQIK